MNWTLITTITLALSSPLNFGLVCGNDAGTSQAQFNKVIVQEAEDHRITQIPGEPEELASNNIPSMEYVPNYDDYNYDNPFIPGAYSSFNIIKVGFELDATVAEVNTFLSEFNAEIVGGYPNVAGILGGDIIVRIPTVNYNELDIIIEVLNSKSFIDVASYDVGLSIINLLPDSPVVPQQSLPTQPDSVLSGWIWELEPKGGNWGLEYIKVPQIWNFNASTVARTSPRITRVSRQRWRAM